MPSARLIYKLAFLLLILGGKSVTAQENSPYSRYGIGDIFPSQNVSTRAMGGLSTIYRNYQNINFNNPASYGQLSLNLGNGAHVTYDIGVSYEGRTLKSADGTSFKSNNLLPSYFSFGLPVSKKKDVGVVIGLRPVSRISYGIISSGRFTAQQVSTKDSFRTIYEGSGGLNQAFLGVGKSFGADVFARQGNKINLKLGANLAFNFGRKENNTNTEIVNDSVLFYGSQHANVTTFNGLGIEFGGMIDFVVAEKMKDKKPVSMQVLTIGATGAFKQKLNATQDIERKTASFDGSTAAYTIDSIYTNTTSGEVVLPAKASFGAALQKVAFNQDGGSAWTLGVQYDMQLWGSQYRFMGATDKVINSWTARIGGEFTPSVMSNSYLSLVTYRLGFFTGDDYINADGNKLKITGITAGFSFPLLSKRGSYTNQFTRINTAFEWGKRGRAVNNVTENYFRVSVGLALSDIWFYKRKYD